MMGVARVEASRVADPRAKMDATGVVGARDAGRCGRAARMRWCGEVRLTLASW